MLRRRRRRGIGGGKVLKARAWIRSFSSNSNSNAMEKQTKTHDHEEAHYVHYNHNDSCKYSRWTTRESHEFMYARPWEQVSDFYSNLVHGRLSLNSLFAIEKGVAYEPLQGMRTLISKHRESINMKGYRNKHWRLIPSLARLSATSLSTA